ncbi:MAG: hypothetical protein KF819_16290 [Labilithrix sp.]|nr:hypothetical protein [Labilithrix sp.]
MVHAATLRRWMWTLVVPLLGMTAPGCTEEAGARRPEVAVTARSADRNSDGTLKRLPPGPPAEPPFTLVLPYEAFGPSAMASRVLGPEWWSWEPGGSFAVTDSFDVRIVVYAGRSASDVRARYPTVRGASDYRYVAKDDAIAYLDEQIASLAREAPADEDDFDFGPLKRRLEETRHAIRTKLGPSKPVDADR